MSKPKDIQENFNRCVCESCSLFTKCNKEKGEKIFCAKKKSDCDMDNNKMCICGICPVYIENNLSGGYFCINEIKE
jgi:hypothetical protein